MPADALPTDLVVAAALRRWTAEGLSAVVARRGAGDRATVLVKVIMARDACRMFVQVSAAGGGRDWTVPHAAPVLTEAEAESYIARAVARDPDLWVVEADDRAGRNPFTM